MSNYLSKKYSQLIPYVPGEQPKDFKYVKLNTNESPFPPCLEVIQAIEKASKNLQLYSDPECKPLVQELAKLYSIDEKEIIFTNGSDEILNFAFMAFCDKNNPAAFPNITYGFYKVFAQLNNIPYEEIPLKDDFTIDVNDYIGINKTIFIANPNAPTGICLSKEDIEKILVSNPNNVVVIDEAYIDFGGESCAGLINKYKNLLVTQTFSKSRSMAGARLGFGVACKELIQDLNTIKYSTNPYNINSLTMSAGVATLKNDQYTKNNCKKIIENRMFVTNELEKLGFEVLPSKANFVFVKSNKISGEKLYLSLKSKGVLVRHFSKEEIKEFNRITIGNEEQNLFLLSKIKEILEESI